MQGFGGLRWASVGQGEGAEDGSAWRLGSQLGSAKRPAGGRHERSHLPGKGTLRGHRAWGRENAEVSMPRQDDLATWGVFRGCFVCWGLSTLRVGRDRGDFMPPSITVTTQTHSVVMAHACSRAGGLSWVGLGWTGRVFVLRSLSSMHIHC